MAVYFWYAERDEKTPVHPHLNQASGLVEADGVLEAWAEVLQVAREDLGNTWATPRASRSSSLTR